MFSKVTDLPCYDLSGEFQKLLDNNVIRWHEVEKDQICLNTVPGQDDNFFYGRGSLDYDWDNSIVDSNGTIKVSLRDVPLKEQDFTVLCSQFRNTVFEDVYNALTSKYKLGRVRIMNLQPKKCLTWHADNTNRVHYPIKTQKGCFMVINSKVQHLDQNTWWFTNTNNNMHTAFNGSKQDRYHLVAAILD